MAKKTGTGVPDSNRANEAATTAEIQLTLAQAQRAFAEALLALASGRVPDIGGAAAARDTEGPFHHDGLLAVDNGELVVVEEEEGIITTFRVNPLLDAKQVRLEFTTRAAESLQPMAQDTLNKVVDELAKFMRGRASVAIRAQISCNGTGGTSGVGGT